MAQPTKLGPYEIGQAIGKGGMGSVYAATDVNTGLRVAVKALSPQLAMAEGFRERFEAEIESLKTLRHDGIVRLFGYGEQDGILFYSMELVDGISLEDEIKAGRRFQWREVSHIAIQLCLALKHAHDHGIIHRDIKPANILLAGDDRVKLTDFGIARLFGMNQLTTAGGVLGTADYMSPEQADGRPITARCDQYSLGGVMYALLAGRPPFRAKNLPEMLQLQRFANPEPVRRFAPDTPEQLEKVIIQLLAKDPDDRFRNTQVLARHLQAMVRALSQPAVDDFALSSGHTRIRVPDADVDASLAMAATQAEEPTDSPSNSVEGADRPSVHNAPTMLGNESTEGVAGSVAPPPPSPSSATPPPVAVEQRRAASAARFTTIEEEQATQRRQQHRSWLSALPQLAGLAAALAALVAVAVYLSRPPTADQLYDEVRSRAEVDDPDSLRDVEREIQQFLERFPDDARAAELDRYRQHIELDRMERRLQVQARREGPLDPSLLPIESLYVQAIGVAQTSPEEAVTMLQSLLDLYDVDALASKGAEGDLEQTAEASARHAACVDLARRQMEQLREHLAQRTARQLASLQERLATADRLAADNPGAAAAMYRAIVDLHQSDDWAEDMVATARDRLAALDEQDQQLRNQ